MSCDKEQFYPTVTDINPIMSVCVNNDTSPDITNARRMILRHNGYGDCIVILFTICWLGWVEHVI